MSWPAEVALCASSGPWPSSVKRFTPGKAAPRASIVGAWTSCSMRIWGAKYPVWGSNTASGWPDALRPAETTSALEFALGSATRPRRPAGSPPLDDAPLPASGPETTVSASLSEPWSGRASPSLAGCLGASWYGNRLRLTVVGASGSSKAANWYQSVRPSLEPIRRWNARSCRTSCSSRPPPLPKMPPTSEAVATTSVSFHRSGPSGRPSAAYSPGMFVGSSFASSMYRLTPAT